MADLREFWARADQRWLADRLGRSLRAVRRMARKVGLRPLSSQARPWGDRELEYLDRHAGVLSLGEIARRLLRSRASVVRMARAMGLSGRTAAFRPAPSPGPEDPYDDRRPPDAWVLEKRRRMREYSRRLREGRRIFEDGRYGEAEARD